MPNVGDAQDRRADLFSPVGDTLGRGAVLVRVGGFGLLLGGILGRCAVQVGGGHRCFGWVVLWGRGAA